MEEAFGISARMAALLSALPMPGPPVSPEVIDLSAAENWLLRPELLKICKSSIADNFAQEACWSFSSN